MNSIYVIAELASGCIKPASMDVIKVASTLRHDRLVVVLMGSGLEHIATQLQFESVSEVLVIENPQLDIYNADAYLAALEPVLKAETPQLVLWAHTYQARDYASALAFRFDADLVGDCHKIIGSEEGWQIERQVFQGKFSAQSQLKGHGISFASLQVGGFEVGELAASVDAPGVRFVKANIAEESIRTRHLEYIEVAERGVDLSAAEIIVAVGRGIKEQANIALAKQLADCLGAELAASRPVCDEGWLPHASQIGSSGQIVRPKVYIALGISGAAQHLVGMRGAAMIIAINKDPNAPIFKIADIAVVADLFEILPPLIKALTATGQTPTPA